MKPSPAFKSALCHGLLWLILAVSRLAAQVDATAWTSVEGTTIWARLDGLDGNRLILHMRGRTYRVPMSRLAPKSLAKAEQMLHLPPGSAGELAGIRQPVTQTVALVATNAPAPVPRVYRPAPQETRDPSPVPVEIAMIPEPAETALQPPSEPVPRPTDGLLDPTPQLPESAAAVDSSMDGYGAVLPPRNSLVPSAPLTSAPPSPGRRIRLEGKTAIAPADVPSTILTAISAGNRLQTKTYKWGGGRARLEDNGYDCSGSVSYVLIKAGLLRSPLTSGGFTRYGSTGPGRWITIHARHGHVFMTICGLRLDTGGSGGRGESGPRWRTHMRGTSGFVMRHPPGF